MLWQLQCFFVMGLAPAVATTHTHVPSQVYHRHLSGHPNTDVGADVVPTKPVHEYHFSCTSEVRFRRPSTLAQTVLRNEGQEEDKTCSGSVAAVSLELEIAKNINHRQK